MEVITNPSPARQALARPRRARVTHLSRRRGISSPQELDKSWTLLATSDVLLVPSAALASSSRDRRWAARVGSPAAHSCRAAHSASRDSEAFPSHTRDSLCRGGRGCRARAISLGDPEDYLLRAGISWRQALHRSESSTRCADALRLMRRIDLFRALGGGHARDVAGEARA